MNTQNFVDFAQIISVIGTLITLIFVWVELKSVERNQKASAIRNIAENERELWLSVLEDDEMTSLMASHLQLSPEFLNKIDISPAAALRLLLFFRQYENIYYQHSHGMLPDNFWNHWEKSMEYTFSNPAIQAVFNRAQVSYSVEYKNFIKEDIVPNLTIFPASNSKKDEHR